MLPQQKFLLGGVGAAVLTINSITINVNRVISASNNHFEIWSNSSGSPVAQIGDDNWLRTITYGDSNDLNIMQQGDDNKLYIYLSTDNAVINAKQKGNNNDGNISVTGDSIYDYTLNFTQDGSDTCVYSYNRNNQSSNVTATVSNGC